jgi:hypothetical protein
MLCGAELVRVWLRNWPACRPVACRATMACGHCCPDEAVIEPEGDIRGRRSRGRGGNRDGTGR